MDRQEIEWLNAYRQGEIDALGRLVDRYRRPLFSFILKMTEGRADAEEVFQETWIRAIRRLDRFHDRNLLGWLFRIAHNLIIDEARKRRPTTPLRGMGMAEGEDALQEPVSNELPIPLKMAEKDLKSKIRSAVRTLPEEQREVFLLRMDGDLPFREIARIQRVSINTALARMQYALKKLRDTLKDDYQELNG